MHVRIGLLVLLPASVRLGARCPSDCSGRGTCESGVCACESGYLPPDCSKSFSCLNNVRRDTNTLAQFYPHMSKPLSNAPPAHKGLCPRTN